MRTNLLASGKQHTDNVHVGEASTKRFCRSSFFFSRRLTVDAKRRINLRQLLDLELVVERHLDLDRLAVARAGLRGNAVFVVSNGAEICKSPPPPSAPQRSLARSLAQTHERARHSRRARRHRTCRSLRRG